MVSKKTGKRKTVFACQNCGTQRPRWEGRCPECGAWNSFVEETYETPSPQTELRQAWTSQTDLMSLDESREGIQIDRASTGISELDRVLGGGLVRGSFVLVGGPPGIGKSTLLLQMAGGLSRQKQKVLYVSGEESVQQTSSRAQRLQIQSGLISVASEANMDQIRQHIEKLSPDVVIIDSIQTIFLPDLESAPGSVSQVRESAGRLLQMAKTQNRTVVLVGHVTKEGSIAGPKVLEHMVDTVLSFEGDDQLSARMLRALKNRFGPAQELGVFRMSGRGLEEVLNPSELFLQERNGEQMGSVVYSSVEGTRPLLCEIQALSVETFQAMPRRTSLGIDVNRLHMIAAVLDRYLRVPLARQDLFINVVGGLKISDPSSDVAVAAALLSTVSSSPVSKKSIFLGEMGLTGEVRSVSQLEVRLREALKLGFQTFYVPRFQLSLAKEILGPKSHLLGLATVDDLKKSIIIDGIRQQKVGRSADPEDRQKSRENEFEIG